MKVTKTPADRLVNKHNEEVKETLSKESFSSLSVSFGDVSFREDLTALFLIESSVPAEVTGAMGKLAAQYAYWASIREYLEDAAASLKHDYEVWHAGKYDSVSSEYAKATETFKESQITVKFGDEYRAWQGKLGDASGALNRVKRVILQSLELKAQMLQSIGAMIRTEQAHQMDGAIMSDGTGDLGRVKKGRTE